MNTKQNLRNKHKDNPTQTATQHCNNELSTYSWLNQSDTIAGYLAKKDEVDIRPFLKEALAKGKTVCLPRYNTKTNLYEMASVTNLNTDVQKGQFNILEPKPHTQLIPIEKIQAWCVPGVAFDWKGNRLGRGNGYYDRLLSNTTGLKIGITTKSRLEPRLPTDPHDIKMNILVIEGVITSIL